MGCPAIVSCMRVALCASRETGVPWYPGLLPLFSRRLTMHIGHGACALLLASVLADRCFAQRTEQESTPSNAQPTAAAIEQTEAGTRPAAEIVAGFDGLGEGFEG